MYMSLKMKILVVIGIIWIFTIILTYVTSVYVLTRYQENQLEQGQAYLESRQYAAAIEIFKTLITENKDAALAYEGLADAYTEVGRTEEAIEILQFLIAEFQYSGEEKEGILKNIESIKLNSKQIQALEIINRFNLLDYNVPDFNAPDELSLMDRLTLIQKSLDAYRLAQHIPIQYSATLEELQWMDHQIFGGGLEAYETQLKHEIYGWSESEAQFFLEDREISCTQGSQFVELKLVSDYYEVIVIPYFYNYTNENEPDYNLYQGSNNPIGYYNEETMTITTPTSQLQKRLYRFKVNDEGQLVVVSSQNLVK